MKEKKKENNYAILKTLALGGPMNAWECARKILTDHKKKDSIIPVEPRHQDVQSFHSTVNRRFEELIKKDFLEVVRSEQRGKVSVDVVGLTSRGFYAILLCDKKTFKDWRDVVKNYPNYFGGSSFEKALLEKATDWCFWFFCLKPYHDLLVSRKISFELDWKKIEEEKNVEMETLIDFFIGFLSNRELDKKGEAFLDFMRPATIEDVQSMRSISRKPEVCEEIANHFRSKKEKLIAEQEVCVQIERDVLALPKMLEYADQELPRLLESIERIRKMEKERRDEV